MDELALYLEVAGGVQKNRVFGLGSSCSSYYGGDGASTSSSQYNPGNAALEQRVEQLQAELQRNNDELQTMRDESTQREADMRRRDEEVQRAVAENRDIQRQLRNQRLIQEQMMTFMQSQSGFTMQQPPPAEDDEDDDEDDGQ